MFNRSLAAAAFASFVAIGTQSAFAAPNAADVPSTTTTTATTSVQPAVPAASQSGTQAAMSAPASGGRARHAARIPGTFTDVQIQGFNDRVMLPPLSGDGGG